MNSIRYDEKEIYPSKVVCIGRNYADHIRELENQVPSEPVVFIKPNSSISSTLQTRTDSIIHFESEISFLLINEQLAGVGFGLDLTRRDIQTALKQQGLPWARAKAFDASAVFSRFVPFDGLVNDLKLELIINAQLRQIGNAKSMLYKPEQLLDEIKTFMTLEDGDILMTGTPEGVGPVIAGDEYTGRIYQRDNMLVEAHWMAQ